MPDRVAWRRRWAARIGLALVAVALAVLLGASSAVSPGLQLTIFRAAQMLVMVLFGFFWVEKFGAERTLRGLLGGYALLAVVIGAAAILQPSLVFAGQRMRGDYIANAGAVGAMGFILMVSFPAPLRRWQAVPLMGLFVALLIFSLTRASYVAVMVFLALAALRRPNVPALRSVYVALSLLGTSVLASAMPGK